MKATLLVSVTPGTAPSIEVRANGVNVYHLLKALDEAQMLLAQRLIREAREAVGDNPEAMLAYLKIKRQQASA